MSLGNTIKNYFALSLFLFGCTMPKAKMSVASNSKPSTNLTTPTVSIGSEVAKSWNANTAKAMVIKGTCQPNGSTVTLSTGSSSKSAICTDGQWSITLDPTMIADGTMKLSVAVSSNKGDKSILASASKDLQVDRTPPALSSVTLISELSLGYMNAAAYATGKELLASLSAAGYDEIGYQIVASTTTCDDSITYDSTIPKTTSSKLIEGNTYKVCVRTADLAQNETFGESKAFAIHAHPNWGSSFTITSPAAATKSTTPTVSWGTAPSASSYTLILASDASCNTILQSFSNQSATSATLSTLAEGTYYLCLTAKDGYGNSTTVTNNNYQFTVDTVAPTVSAISISNSNPSATNVLSMSVTGADARTNVSHFCLNYNVTTQPTLSSSCWVAVNAPSPGLTPALTLNLSAYNYLSGYTPGNYNVYVWVRDAAGNISSLVNSGTGTAGVDKATIVYTPGTAPVVYDVIGAVSDAPSNPMTTGDSTIASGASVYIKWHAEDAEALAATPIDIYYTTDNKNFTLIISNLTNGQNGGCSVNNAGSTLDDNATGCYLWISGSPSSSYYRIQVRAKDSSSMVTTGSSNAVNGGNIKNLTGNTDPGLNSSASSAIFMSDATQVVSGDPHSLLIASNGTIFYRDPVLGVLYVSPTDGILKMLLNNTGTNSGDDGDVGSATARAALAIAFDEQERVLVFDYDRIRRIDTKASPMIISNLIGGGALTTDNVAAANVAFTYPGAVASVNVKNMMFATASDGRVFFQSDNFGVTQPSAGYRIRIYSPQTGLVTSISPSGIGHSGDTTSDLSDCAFYHLGIAFDPASSTIASMQGLLIHRPWFTNCPATANSYYFGNASLNPSTGAALAPHPTSFNPYGHFVTAMNGQLYYAAKLDAVIRKYDSTTNTWSTVAGNSVTGTCADNTAALSCPIDLSDVFVNASGTIYFSERGKIRSIDSGGKIITVFGQGYSYGDGGAAISARYKYIQDFDLTNNNHVVILDRAGYSFRDATIGGNVQLLAGNGSNTAPDTTNSAVSQGITFNTAGAFFDRFALDPSNGNIYFNRGSTELSYLNRATGKWVDFAGGGATDYWNADGLTGNNVKFYDYFPVPVGFDGQSVLVADHRYVNPNAVNSYLMLYDKDTTVQTNLVGSGNNSTATGVCASGTSVTSCTLPTVHNATPKAFFDSYTNNWLISEVNNTFIRLVPTGGGNVSTLLTAPRSFSAFAYNRSADASTNVVYYCANSNGALYKYDLNTSTETALNWPITGMTCGGKSLIYSQSRSSLIFTYTLNNLAGVAEYVNP